MEQRIDDLTRTRLREVDLSGSRLRSVVLRDVDVTDAWVEDVRIDGHVVSLEVNGVDVAPFVEAELDRRHPERRGLRATDVGGLRHAWAEAVSRWDDAVERARRLPAELLDERVADEFSFVQTLRHLVFATDRWLTGPVFGQAEAHFERLGLPAEDGVPGPELDLDLDARPSLDEVLAIRHRQRARIDDLLSTMDEEGLGRSAPSPNGGDTTVLACLQLVLKEEWWHHRYATRDLGTLEATLRG